MTSAKFSDFFTLPSSPQIHAASLTMVAYYVCVWRYPPSPLSADIINGSPLTNNLIVLTHEKRKTLPARNIEKSRIAQEWVKWRAGYLFVRGKVMLGKDTSVKSPERKPNLLSGESSKMWREHFEMWMKNAAWSVRLWKRFWKMVSESSPFLLGQHISRNTTQQPVELYENILQNIFTTDAPNCNVMSHRNMLRHNAYQSSRSKREERRSSNRLGIWPNR